MRVTGTRWKKDGQTAGFLQSWEKVEEAEKTAPQVPTENKPGKQQVPYREAENPAVGDPLPRWLIRLLMRKEALWNCTIR